MNRSLYWRYHYHRVRRACSNYALVKTRDCDGLILSMHQSGTHWIKFMLASAMASRYDLPAPQFNHANDIIGGRKDPVLYRQAPVLKSSHSLPPWPYYSAGLFRALSAPPCVVLVRDHRASLVSNYNKWAERYGCSFSEYLRGDPAGHRFNSDIWWCIRFMNAWALAAQRLGTKLLLVRYEDLQADATSALERINSHFELALSDSDIQTGIAAGKKDTMSARHDPSKPDGEIRNDERPWQDWYSAEDRVFVDEVSEKLLSAQFADRYRDWPASSS